MFSIVDLHEPALFTLIFLATSGLTVVHLLVLLVLGILRKRRLRARELEKGSLPAPPLSVAFVVAVYNDELSIGACIESILAQSRPADEVLVVDDASTDRTPEILQTFAERGVRVIRMEKNGGKTRALEVALLHTNKDLIAITDADSIVHRDYVKEILPNFRDPLVAGVGGAVESLPHTWVTAARQVEYLITLKVDRSAEDMMGAILVLPGVSTTYRRVDLAALGFEHDTIAEDFDLTFRLHKAGKKLTMEPRAIVYTSDPPTLGAYRRQLTRWYTDLWITVKKHRNMLGKKVFGAVEVPLLVINMLSYSLLVLGVPIILAIFAPAKLVTFFLVELAMDAALTTLAIMVYKRPDIAWAVLSRAPTRFIARFVTLTTFFRVAIGRPGRDWVKLERRRTEQFLGLTQKAMAKRG